MRVEKINTHWEDIDMAHLELGKLILHFEQSNKAEGKSSKTVVWYTEMLDSFTKFLLLTGQVPILANFNATIVREFNAVARKDIIRRGLIIIGFILVLAGLTIELITIG